LDFDFMALAQHFIANNGFNPVNIPLNSNPLGAEDTLLQTEGFPGELASLRAQLSQIKTPKIKADKLTAHQQKLSQNSPNSLLDSSFMQEKMADQLIEMMPTGLVMLDGNGVVVKINKVARSLLEEPILGQLWFTVIARSFKPRADDWHEVSLKDGRRVKLEIASLGNQPGQLIMITDLTETRLLQDKVGQMQRLSSLGRMVSTLAHQIRTPLSAAMLYSANLSNRKLSESARGSFQEKLSSRLRDLEQQINDMLLFSKSGNEQVVSSLSVNELINDAIQAMDALIIKAKTQVNLNLTTDDHHILGNKNALTGAIQNLVHNALQAASAKNIEQAVINIQVYSNKNSVYISVKDNGPGINSADVEKIFEPFYTSSSKGTGLGLAVVKSVVEAHQGEVNYLSKAGEGAHFCIKLPLLEQVKASSINKTNIQEKQNEPS
jgi:two-component system sensor histidine kinase FlrB